MTPRRIELTAAVILWVILAILVTATVAVAQDKGADVWAYADAKRQYQDSAEAAGSNYDRIPIAYREHALRSELAYTACVATYNVKFRNEAKHHDAQTIRRMCVDDQGKWGVWLNMALQDSGAFPYAYFGQTAIALMDVKRVHRVIRLTLRELTYEDARKAMVLKKYMVPALMRELRAAQKTGEIPTPNRNGPS